MKSSNPFLSDSPITVPEPITLYHSKHREIYGIDCGFIHEYLNTQPCAAILAVLIDGTETKFLLVKQPRPALKKATIEIPKGKIEFSESPEEGATRELKEETGYTANSMKPLCGPLANSPGGSNELTYIFLATDLEKGEACPDPEEDIIADWVSLEQLKLGFQNGSYRDLVTRTAILEYLFRFDNH